MKRPLRIAALVAAAAGAFATLWLALGSPGSFGPDDPYYRLALARSLLPFAAAGAMVAALVFVASGTPRSRRRFASIALWLLLLGAVALLAEAVLQITVGSAPRRFVDFNSSAMWRQQWLMWLSMTGAYSLIGGGALWIASYGLDRPRKG